jgi:branched-chain amino acid transport system permease protein
MMSFEEIKQSTISALWFVFLTFPIMVIKVDSIEKTVTMALDEWFWVALGSFLCLSCFAI